MTEVQADQWDEALRGRKMSDASGRVIFKYQMPVLEQFEMTLPQGAEIIRMKDECGMFWLWAIVRTDVPDETRKFWAFKCGGKIPDDLNIRYVGFCAVFVQQGAWPLHFRGGRQWLSISAATHRTIWA